MICSFFSYFTDFGQSSSFVNLILYLMARFFFKFNFFEKLSEGAFDLKHDLSILESIFLFECMLALWIALYLSVMMFSRALIFQSYVMSVCSILALHICGADIVARRHVELWSISNQFSVQRVVRVISLQSEKGRLQNCTELLICEHQWLVPDSNKRFMRNPHPHRIHHSLRSTWL